MTEKLKSCLVIEKRMRININLYIINLNITYKPTLKLIKIIFYYLPQEIRRRVYLKLRKKKRINMKSLNYLKRNFTKVHHQNNIKLKIKDNTNINNQLISKSKIHIKMQNQKSRTKLNITKDFMTYTKRNLQNRLMINTIKHVI